VTLEDGIHAAEDPAFDAIAFHEALEALSKEDDRAAVITELHVFGGMTLTDIAGVLGVSRRTVNADWAYARRWLSRAMNSG
jgi:DNA-directed RNA polymerase specialized sigma24 family protein